MYNLFIVIEFLESQHREKLIPMLRSCVSETDIDLDTSIPHYIYNLGQNTGVIAVNVYGDPIAYMLYNKSNGRPLFITHFWVHPEYRRKKVGTRLIATISRTESKRPLTVIVHETLVSAQLFLCSVGFKCTCIMPSDNINNDQYWFTLSARNPLNRLEYYNPRPF